MVGCFSPEQTLNQVLANLRSEQPPCSYQNSKHSRATVPSQDHQHERKSRSFLFRWGGEWCRKTKTKAPNKVGRGWSPGVDVYTAAAVLVYGAQHVVAVSSPPAQTRKALSCRSRPRNISRPTCPRVLCIASPQNAIKQKQQRRRRRQLEQTYLPLPIPIDNTQHRCRCPALLTFGPAHWPANAFAAASTSPPGATYKACW